MKTLKIIFITCIIISLSATYAHAQPNKKDNPASQYTMVFTGTTLYQIECMNEDIKIDYIIEETFSDKFVETKFEGTGIGRFSGLTYTVSSEISTRYHGKNNKDEKFNQSIVVKCEGNIVTRIVQMILFKANDDGELIPTIEKYTVDCM